MNLYFLLLTQSELLLSSNQNKIQCQVFTCHLCVLYANICDMFPIDLYEATVEDKDLFETVKQAHNYQYYQSSNLLFPFSTAFQFDPQRARTPTPRSL